MPRERLWEALALGGGPGELTGPEPAVTPTQEDLVTDAPSPSTTAPAEDESETPTASDGVTPTVAETGTTGRTLLEVRSTPTICTASDGR